MKIVVVYLVDKYVGMCYIEREKVPKSRATHVPKCVIPMHVNKAGWC